MKTRLPAIFSACLAAAAWAGGTRPPPPQAAATGRGAGEKAAIALPAPNMALAAPLMEAIRERKSTREFSERPLSRQELSDVLWAAAGITRNDGRRTAGSTCNWQAVEVYAVLEDGIYAYDAKGHALKQIAAGDFRKLAGKQDFVAGAPLNLLYVGDLGKMKIPEREKQWLFLGADAGLMGENVYLYCAAAGLATVVRGSVDGASLAKAMGLAEGKAVLLAQTVGKPRARPLVVYYSWGGNTRRAAQAMAKAIDADLYEIKTKDPYPADYASCVKEAGEQIRKGVRPELAEGGARLAGREVVIVGGPCWWGTVAPPVAAFLESQDFSGKKVAFFATHGGGGMQQCAADAAKAARVAFAATNAWAGTGEKSPGDAFAAWAKEVAEAGGE